MNTILQKLQRKQLSEIDSILDNLFLIVNTYSGDINMLNSFGINYFNIDINNIKYAIEREEPRIQIQEISYVENNIDINFIFNNQIFSWNNSRVQYGQ